MFATSKWCPICTFNAEMPNEERCLCPTCKGDGMQRCARCICLPCSGLGEVACTGCDQGRNPCSRCQGTGKAPGFLAGGNCKHCDGTGQEHHSACDGTGVTVCLACAGIGSESECHSCDSTGEIRCPQCFGAGLAPTQELLRHAARSPLARILKELPLVEKSEGGGYLNSLVDTIAGITGFLGSVHWDFQLAASAREHEMTILSDRIHFRASALATEGRHVNVAYRFFDVVRLGPDAFRCRFRESEKAWR